MKGNLLYSNDFEQQIESTNGDTETDQERSTSKDELESIKNSINKESKEEQPVPDKGS